MRSSQARARPNLVVVAQTAPMIPQHVDRTQHVLEPGLWAAESVLIRRQQHTGRCHCGLVSEAMFTYYVLRASAYTSNRSLTPGSRFALLL